MLAFWRVLIEGYKTERRQARMVYGIAMHKYIDTMFKTKGNIGKARDAAFKEFDKPKVNDDKSKHLSDRNHLIINCFNYWEEVIMKEFKLETVMMPDGQPATEVTFSIPYYEDDYIVVTLEGTIDRLVKIINGCFAVDDFKTTSSWKKDEYLEAYDMSHQLRFYVFALKLMAEKHPDSMLGKIGATNVGALIEGIFLKPNVSDTEYQRSKFIQFKDLDEHRRALDLKIQHISRTVKEVQETGNLPPKEGLMNGSCEHKYGKCSFWAVCKVADPAIEKMLLKRDFVQKPYDPLNHNDDI